MSHMTLRVHKRCKPSLADPPHRFCSAVYSVGMYAEADKLTDKLSAHAGKDADALRREGHVVTGAPRCILACCVPR